MIIAGPRVGRQFSAVAKAAAGRAGPIAVVSPGCLMRFSEDAIYFDEADWNPVRGQLASTFNVRFPRFFESMIFDINIHLPLPHHLAPSVPWYNLRRPNDALHIAFPRYVEERALSWRALRAMWKKPILEKEGDHYVTVELPG